MPEPLKPKEELDLYEGGKNRRYSLLFAVNGGAFAIVKFAEEGNAYYTGGLTNALIALGMVLFTILMVLDIYAFGFWCKNRFAEKVFGRIGQIVLGSIGVLICAAWLLLGFQRSSQPYSNAAIGMLVVLIVGGALISFVNEYVSRQFKTDIPAAAEGSEKPPTPSPDDEQST